MKELKIPKRMPADVSRALNTFPQAKKQWKTVTPLAKRDWLLWVVTAKKVETRKSRIQKMMSMLTAGKRRVCCFPGANWLMKNSK